MHREPPSTGELEKLLASAAKEEREVHEALGTIETPLADEQVDALVQRELGARPRRSVEQPALGLWATLAAVALVLVGWWTSRAAKPNPAGSVSDSAAIVLGEGDDSIEIAAFERNNQGDLTLSWNDRAADGLRTYVVVLAADDNGRVGAELLRERDLFEPQCTIAAARAERLPARVAVRVLVEGADGRVSERSSVVSLAVPHLAEVGHRDQRSRHTEK